jgi:tRNA (guanine-N7-)-methyltransferase
MTSEPGINPRDTGLGLLDLREIFGNANPVMLEIGSGKGRFLIESAKLRPDNNFLGVEKSLHYYRVIVDRLRRHGLPNARIVNFDAYPVLAQMLEESSVSGIHIYFPDPWPRKREKKRRLVREEVVREMRRVLVPEGSGIYVTDHREYFEEAMPVLRQFFSVTAGEVPDERPPRTNYEAKYRQQGRPIYEAVFQAG